MSASVTLVAVGDNSSKKTKLLEKYTWDETRNRDFQPYKYETTICDLIVDYKRYSVEFIDAECDDDYEVLRWTAYEKASAIILCYSIEDRNSFHRVVSKWSVEIRKIRPTVPIILVATDVEKRSSEMVEGRRQLVSESEGENIKCAINARVYVECSVEKSLAIDDVFVEAIRCCCC